MHLNFNKPFWRALVFCLAATSIACLLTDFYGLCPMRLFVFAVFIPALIALMGIALVDQRIGGGTLAREICVGLFAGLVAAVAYDIFRLPFVYAGQWGIESVVPPMDLFKVFPRFGAMILNQPVEQAQYSPAAQIVGWIYHFSNGASFGIMYMAWVAPRKVKEWWRGVLMAVGIEAALLLTPYASRFGIIQNARFVQVTLVAHLIFGATLGLFCCWIWPRKQLRSNLNC